MSDSPNGSSSTSPCVSTPTTTPTSPEQREMPEEVRVYLSKYHYHSQCFVRPGSTSSVFKLTNSTTGDFLAAKVIQLSRLSTLMRELVENELKITRVVRHQYIVRIDQVFRLTEYAVIVTEFADQGDLIGYIEHSADHRIEPNIALAKRWFLQVAQALVYLHAKGIAHGDIKADNILLCAGTAKLADFGYSTYCRDSRGQILLSKIFCGTLEYKAPETIQCNTPYNAMIADCFSLGVLLYVMVTHQFPYDAGEAIRTASGMLALYQEEMNQKWQPVGVIREQAPLYSLLRQLLNPDTVERITAAQVLAHPWFARPSTSDSPTASTD